jgi:MoaA/NifB/PqqE/SkfB family radical SAM enzyme
MTLSRKNYWALPRVIVTMSSMGVWTFFDMIHPDRGQPGSKVKNADPDLLFQPKDVPSLLDSLQKVEALKLGGYLCHASLPFVEILREYMGGCTENPYTWNCASDKIFPAWVTVDCDGTVYPCDDFQPKDVTMIKVWEIDEMWRKFSSSWRREVHDNCPGCLWNTHIDANLIKSGFLPLTDYIHGVSE